MNRRSFILHAGTAVLCAPTLLHAATANFEPYTPGVIQEHLAAGDVVFVDYWASWCSTCRTQDRVLNQLLERNPAYQRAMKFVRVDWDIYARHPVTTDRGIPRRSTLIVLKGNDELGRVVAQTGQRPIRALLDIGLAAA